MIMKKKTLPCILQWKIITCIKKQNHKLQKNKIEILIDQGIQKNLLFIKTGRNYKGRDWPDYIKI